MTEGATFILTADDIWNALYEAREKKQNGILIWANSTQFDEHSDQLIYGDYSSSILTQVSNAEVATITTHQKGYSTPCAMAVPVLKMLMSKEFFEKVIKVIRQDFYSGPITMIPTGRII